MNRKTILRKHGRTVPSLIKQGDKSIMEHILLLHIGMSKTGTSALQKFLYNNMENLKKYGWSYPDLKTVIGTAESYYVAYQNASVLYREKNRLDVFSENWVYSWEFIKKELEEYNVILSSELIFEFGAEQFIKEVKKQYDNLKVIIYLRRQDLFFESYWAQLIKSDGYTNKFEESRQELEHYFNYLDLLNLISNIIGKENLIVRVYEKGQFRGDRSDIFSDFFDVAGIYPNWKDFCEGGIVNKSLFGKNYLELRRIFNTLKEIDGSFPQISKNYFLKLSNLLPKEEKNHGYFMNKQEREMFLGKFQKDNQIIAEQYVQNENGILFSDMDTDIPYMGGGEASAFEEDLIRLFGAIVCSNIKRIDFLEKSVQRTTKMIIDLQRKGRVIAYFGGGQKCRELIKKYCWDVGVIIDNDERKSGSQIDGIPVISFLNVSNWGELFIIITCVDTSDIEKQLETIGLIKNLDFVLANEFLY